MNKKEKIIELKSSILQKELQLKKLDSHVDSSKICSDLYNKVVIEKAELNKQLKDIENDNIVNNLFKILPKKKTLICDYFKK